MKRSQVFIFILVSTALFAGSSGKPPIVVKPSGSEGKKIPSFLKKERPAPRTADPQAEAVVEAYLKAIGGREALAAIQDRYEKFLVSKHSTTGKTPALFQRYMKRPNMIREDWDMELKIGDQPLTVIQVFNGKTGEGWTKMMGVVAPLESNMISMLTWDKYIDDFFLHWKEDGYSLRYRSGSGSVNGEPCDVIDVFTPVGNQEFRYFFSKKTHLLLKKQWRVDNSQEGPVRNELFYLEYRKVKNPKAPDKPILFSFKREQYSDGNLTLEREYYEVKLNPGLSDKIFGRPEGPLWKGRVQKGKKGAKKPKKALPPWKRKRRILPKGISRKSEGSSPTATDLKKKKTEKKEDSGKK